MSVKLNKSFQEVELKALLFERSRKETPLCGAETLLQGHCVTRPKVDQNINQDQDQDQDCSAEPFTFYLF